MQKRQYLTKHLYLTVKRRVEDKSFSREKKWMKSQKAELKSEKLKLK